MLIGIVGKPNCGKSTFFKAATLAEAEIANYPFTTIKANEGAGFIRTTCAEKDFNVRCNPQQGECIDGQRFVPVKLIDVAGLVPGAHKGKGLGNKFLNDLSSADVLIHVIDASGSTNEKGEPVKAGSYDPKNDIKFLEEEIDLWFAALLAKGWKKFMTKLTAEKKPFDKAVAEQFSGLKIDLSMVKKALKNSPSKPPKDWKEEEINKFASELRKASKPIIIAANKIDIPTAKILNKTIPCSAEAELALKEAANKNLIKYIPGDSDFKILKPEKLTDKQKRALQIIKKILSKYGATGVQKTLNKAAEGLITAYPVPNANLKDARGNILPDAYLLQEGSTALDLAYQIHTDIAKKFIRAIDIKTKRTVGKDHKLKDGDVIERISGK
jgi:ribosome-binding ATPase YchF (GTP1/OBG family)